MRQSSRISKNRSINRPDPIAEIKAAGGDLREAVRDRAEKAILDKASDEYRQIFVEYGRIMSEPTPALFSVLFATWGSPDWKLLRLLFSYWPGLQVGLYGDIGSDRGYPDRGLRRVVFDTMDCKLLRWLWKSGYMSFREQDVEYVQGQREALARAFPTSIPGGRWGPDAVLELLDKAMRGE